MWNKSLLLGWLFGFLLPQTTVNYPLYSPLFNTLLAFLTLTTSHHILSRSQAPLFAFRWRHLILLSTLHSFHRLSRPDHDICTSYWQLVLESRRREHIISRRSPVIRKLCHLLHFKEKSLLPIFKHASRTVGFQEALFTSEVNLLPHLSWSSYRRLRFRMVSVNLQREYIKIS